MARPTLDWRAPEYTPVIRYRARLLERLRADPAALGAALKHYETSPVDFIEDWGVTYDPRNRKPLPTGVPFLLFPKQREAIEYLHRCVEDEAVGTFDKSREVGATWLCVAYATWLWLFRPGSSVGFGSQYEKKVDKIGDLDSILEKVRFFVRRLPREFRPEGYAEKVHAVFMKILNPENGASITGEAGDDIGRGGRKTVFFLDEAASIAHPQSVDASLSATTRVQVHVSTARGPGNPFYRKVHGGEWRHFRLHWRDDPRKDDAWYAEQTRRFDPAVVAQEIDIDYHASIERIVIDAAWVRAARDIGPLVDWPEFGGGVAGLDVAAGGSGESVFVARFGPFVDPPRSWTQGDTTTTAYEAMAELRRAGATALNFDVVGVGEGVAATLKRLKTWGLTDPTTGRPVERLGYAVERTAQITGVNVGSSPTDRLWTDGKRAHEKFANLKAELWWTMRDRFQATYEHYLHLKGEPDGCAHDPSELIVLPDDERLATQLSTVTWDVNTWGKITIESKKDLARRGIRSPDRADALVLTFAEPRGSVVRVADLEGMY